MGVSSECSWASDGSDCSGVCRRSVVDSLSEGKGLLGFDSETV